MIDKDAIIELKRADEINHTNAAITAALAVNAPIVATGQDISITKLEQFYPNRKRARGTMTTSDIDAFAAYVGEHAEPGAMVFVDDMHATAVLNLGQIYSPGHADNLAKFNPRETAAYTEMRAAAGRSSPRMLAQRDLAEWLEDWADIIQAASDSTTMTPGQAAAAVRSVTIDAAKQAHSAESALSVERSAMESVKASSRAGMLPTDITLMCEPYLGLAPRHFRLRVTIHPTDKAVNFSLRIAMLEQHAEEMQQELVGLIEQAIAASGQTKVLIGKYEPKA